MIEVRGGCGAPLTAWYCDASSWSCCLPAASASRVCSSFSRSCNVFMVGSILPENCIQPRLSRRTRIRQHDIAVRSVLSAKSVVRKTGFEIGLAAAAGVAVATLFAGLGFVDGQAPAVVLFLMQAVDGGLRFVAAVHLDKAEALRAAGVPVHD